MPHQLPAILLSGQAAAYLRKLFFGEGHFPAATLTLYLNEAGSCSGTAMLIWKNFVRRIFVRRIIQRLIDVSENHANSLDPTSP